MLKWLMCSKFRSWITRYLTGDLEPASRVEQLERHVATCESCQQAVAERRKMLNELLSRNTSEEDLEDALRALGLRPVVNRPLGAVLSVLLAVALFGSAYLWRLANPAENLLGPKAATVTVEKPAAAKLAPRETAPTVPRALKSPPADRKATPPTTAVTKPPTKAPAKAKVSVKQPKPSVPPVASRPTTVTKKSPPSDKTKKPPEPEPKKPAVRTEVEILDASGSVVRRAGAKVPTKEKRR